MGIKVREKISGSGEWWLFINHKGVRKTKKVGSEDSALEVKNLFDEKYVGAIYASDTIKDVDYYAGSPFTVIFSIGGKF